MLAEQPDNEKPKEVVRHTVNGDGMAGWYCYQCHFFTRDVEEAAKHDGTFGYTKY